MRGTRGLGEEGKVSHPMGWPSTPWQSLQAPGPLRDAQGPLIAPLGGEEAGPVQGELQWAEELRDKVMSTFPIYPLPCLHLPFCSQPGEAPEGMGGMGITHLLKPAFP